jgi:hypothetical protein
VIRSAVLGRAAVRGLTAAMAMSGLRTFTANLGLLRQSPPDAIVDRHAPRLLRNRGPGTRMAVTELAHWLYGAGGGVMFGLLPGRLRAHPWTGPVYGVVVWLGFELGVGPLLGVQGRQGGVGGRLILMADHALYGAVVAGRLAPEPRMIEREREGS